MQVCLPQSQNAVSNAVSSTAVIEASIPATSNAVEAMGLQWCCDYRAPQVSLADQELPDTRPLKRAAGPRRATMGVLGRQRYSRLRSAEDSENVVPMKQTVVMDSLAAPVLSDVTNIGSHRLIAKVPRPSISSANALPAKQPSSAAIAALAAAAAASSVTSGMAATGRGLPAAAVVAAASAAASVRPPQPAPPVKMETSVPEVTMAPSRHDVVEEQDPQQVKEYLSDINANLMAAELHFLPEANYMENQPHVNAKMRAILVDWLVDVHKKYKLRQETLFLAVSLIDRYLERRSTVRKHLQLVGVAALLIASKFEELYPPQVQDFVYISDKAYTKDEVIKMEVSVLSVLDFKVCQPTAVHFMDRFHRINGCEPAHRDLAQYLLELTLVEYNMVKYSPSHLAAAALLLSNKLLRRQPSWDEQLLRKTGFSENMLRDSAREICGLLENAESSSMQAVRKKFSQQKFNAVSKLNFTADSSSRPSESAGASSMAVCEQGAQNAGGDMEVEDAGACAAMDSVPI